MAEALQSVEGRTAPDGHALAMYCCEVVYRGWTIAQSSLSRTAACTPTQREHMQLGKQRIELSATAHNRACKRNLADRFLQGSADQSNNPKNLSPFQVSKHTTARHDA